MTSNVKWKVQSVLGSIYNLIYHTFFRAIVWDVRYLLAFSELLLLATPSFSSIYPSFRSNFYSFDFFYGINIARHMFEMEIDFNAKLSLKSLKRFKQFLLRFDIKFYKGESFIRSNNLKKY